MSVFAKALFNFAFYPFAALLTAAMFLFFFFPLLLLRITAGKRFTLKVLRFLIRVYGFIVVKILAFPFIKVKHTRQREIDKKQACVYICNHRAASDAFLMFLPGREIIQVVNLWPFKIPIIGWVAERAGYLNVKKFSFDYFSSKALKLLNEGVSLAVFPEGSRATNLDMGQFNGAVFRVALQARVPVVPVCISGNDRIPERETGIFNSGTIRVSELRPLQWEEYKDMPPFKFKNHVREIIQAEFNRVHAV